MTVITFVRIAVAVLAAGCLPFVLEAWRKDRPLAVAIGSILTASVALELAALATGGVGRYSPAEALLAVGVFAVCTAIAVDLVRDRQD